MSVTAALPAMIMGSPHRLPGLPSELCWDDGAPLDVNAACAQWDMLREAVERCVGEVLVLEPGLLARSTTFVRDLGLAIDGSLVLLRPAGLRGLLEPPSFARMLRSSGIDLADGPLPALDGGNVMADHHGRLLVGLCGEPTSSLRAAVDALKVRTGRTAIGVPLAGGRWPHLDMALADLGGRGWLVHPEALAGYDRTDAAWREVFAGRPVIEIAPDEANGLACNVLVAGDVVIGPPVGACTRRRVEALGFRYEAVDVSELVKAGGGVHCLTLELG
ncbi:MAG: dimethylarginine dimethylaminohydrolase family protein [Acidimicrobiales bacterium]